MHVCGLLFPFIIDNAKKKATEQILAYGSYMLFVDTYEYVLRAFVRTCVIEAAMRRAKRSSVFCFLKQREPDYAQSKPHFVAKTITIAHFRMECHQLTFIDMNNNNNNTNDNNDNDNASRLERIKAQSVKNLHRISPYEWN